MKADISSVFLLILFVSILSGCAIFGNNSVPASFKPEFSTNKAISLLKFKDDMWVTKEDLTFKIGEGEYRAEITVPKGFVTDRTSFLLFRYNEKFDNSAILHDYMYWIQPCDHENGAKISDKIIKQSLKSSGHGIPLSWVIKKLVSIFGMYTGWNKNSKLKNEKKESRFVDKENWGEISGFTWEDFKTKYPGIQREVETQENQDVKNHRICSVFKKWRKT